MGMKRMARTLFAIMAALLMLSVVVQTFFAGMGVFGEASGWKLHIVFVRYFDKLALVMFLLSFAGGIRGWLRWLSLIVFGMTSLQYVSAQLFSERWMIAAFHPVNALLLFWATLHLCKRSWIWLRPGEASVA